MGPQAILKGQKETLDVRWSCEGVVWGVEGLRVPHDLRPQNEPRELRSRPETHRIELSLGFPGLVHAVATLVELEKPNLSHSLKTPADDPVGEGLSQPVSCARLLNS